jgi:hypothetical protein
MALDIKKVEYYNVTVDGDAAEGFKLLSVFASAGVNMIAFKAVPLENKHTRFSIFPDDGTKMIHGANKAGLKLEGPHSALMVKGYNDESGECANIHEKLSKAGIHVFESNGIADIRDSYGVVLYLKEEDCEKAIVALEV